MALVVRNAACNFLRAHRSSAAAAKHDLPFSQMCDPPFVFRFKRWSLGSSGIPRLKAGTCRTSLFCMGLMVAPLWFGTLPNVAEAMAGAGGDSALPTIPFIFVSLLGAQTGGFSALSESFYIGQDGRVQMSKESSDGRLHRLHDGLVETESFFEEIIRVSSAQNTENRQRATAQGDLTDYYPPKVVLAYATPLGEYSIKSYSRQQIPETVAEFADRVTALRERPELAAAEPGLYIRAQHLPRFDPRIQKPDLVITVEEAVRDANLWNAVRREMALVRVGSLDENVLIIGSLALRPEHPVHVQVGDIVYRIITYAPREYAN